MTTVFDFVTKHQSERTVFRLSLIKQFILSKSIIKMNEDLKFIISGLNKLLGKNYNLISFNALSSQELIQVKNYC